MRVKVAASSANLGSGFDCVGLALGCYDEVEAELIDDGIELLVEGQGADSVPLDETHLVVRSIRLGLDAWGVPMPGLRLKTRNKIPHARGLGSSAAAIVAGLAIAWGIAFPGRDLDRDELLRLSTEAEGHPDNAGAAVFGGALLAWSEPPGVVHRVPLTVHPGIRYRVFIPQTQAPTSQARKILPNHVPRSDAVLQASRAALLMHALVSSPEHLMVATQDYLHQPYRAELMQPSWQLMHRLREVGIPAVISGAGPTVLALGTSNQLSAQPCADGFVSADLPIGEGVQLSF